jgi:ubiquinone biosynthesis protein
LTLLFEITALFDMQTRTELVMLQKTMVVAEGVARKLDPHLDMWTVSEPIVREYVERYLGPRGYLEDAGRSAQALGIALRDAPKMLERLDRMTQPWDDPAVEPRWSAPQSGGGSRWRTAALWAIAAALAWIGFALR